MLRWGTFQVARVFGIPIRVHFSLLLLVGYILYVVRAEEGGLIQTTFALLLALALFTSVALHELGHSLVARKKGCRVREITLLFIGGVAQMERIPERPRDELLMAVAGPAVSVALGTLLLAPGLYLTTREWGFCGQLMTVAGGINYAWAAFNLLPAFPMDGGRVLRALLTRRLGRLRATAVAARLGKLLAVGMALIGWFGLPSVGWPRNPMLVVIAVFVYMAARREYLATVRAAWLKAMGLAWPENDAAEREPEPLTAWVGPPPFRPGQGQTVVVRRGHWGGETDEDV